MTRSSQRPSHRRARWIATTVLAVVGLNAGLYALDSFYGSPSGTPSSAFATIPRGVAAFAELLNATGFRVHALRTPLAAAEIPPDGTLLVLEPHALGSDEIDTMRRLAAGGTRIVAGGTNVIARLDELLDDPPEWSQEPAGTVHVTRPVPGLGDVAEIEARGAGSWSDPGSADRLSGTGVERLLLTTPLGEGEMWLLADVSPLQNRALGRADNAALGLGLAGPQGTTVYFAESVHGYSNATGLAAIPVRWRWSLGFLSVAALVWLYARSRRLGPPQPLPKPLGPRRTAYVDALATTLARTRRPTEAVQPVRTAARMGLIRRAGLAKDAQGEELTRAAEVFGLDEAETAAIVDPTRDPDPLAAGRALARLSSTATIGGDNGE